MTTYKSPNSNAMKKFFLAVLCSVFLCNPSVILAQTEQAVSELGLQVSDGLPVVFVNALTIGLVDAFSVFFSDYDSKRDSDIACPGLRSVGYRYHVTPRFKIKNRYGLYV